MIGDGLPLRAAHQLWLSAVVGAGTALQSYRVTELQSYWMQALGAPLMSGVGWMLYSKPQEVRSMAAACRSMGNGSWSAVERAWWDVGRAALGLMRQIGFNH